MGFTTFETTLGRCGIAWNDRGVTRVLLPGRRRLQDETEPPDDVRRAIAGIVALLGGQRVDLGYVELDLSDVSAFDRSVYETARTIPPGATMTYGEVARQLGDAALAREVGQALARNPFSIVVPCHRVVASSGKLGGFSASGGLQTKHRMLTIEGGLPGFG
jgi:methylated-DNA-[protein]-cysteine S-methyltransferase